MGQASILGDVAENPHCIRKLLHRRHICPFRTIPSKESFFDMTHIEFIVSYLNTQQKQIWKNTPAKFGKYFPKIRFLDAKSLFPTMFLLGNCMPGSNWRSFGWQVRHSRLSEAHLIVRWLCKKFSQVKNLPIGTRKEML